MAHRLAERFGFAHLDTGTLYRAAALLLLERGEDANDRRAAEAAARRVTPALLADPRLRDEGVAAASSVVAALPSVRRILLAFQRDFAAHPPDPTPGVAATGAVLDGRDIGSVVCPDAALKIFLTAELDTRTRRRVEELRGRGATAIYEDVLQDLMKRDARDSERRAAPLAAAPDAEIIDTTALDADAVLECAAALVARAAEEKEWL